MRLQARFCDDCSSSAVSHFVPGNAHMHDRSLLSTARVERRDFMPGMERAVDDAYRSKSDRWPCHVTLTEKKAKKHAVTHVFDMYFGPKS